MCFLQRQNFCTLNDDILCARSVFTSAVQIGDTLISIFLNSIQRHSFSLVSAITLELKLHCKLECESFIQSFVDCSFSEEKDFTQTQLKQPALWAAVAGFSAKAVLILNTGEIMLHHQGPL